MFTGVHLLTAPEVHLFLFTFQDTAVHTIRATKNRTHISLGGGGVVNTLQYEKLEKWVKVKELSEGGGQGVVGSGGDKVGGRGLEGGGGGGGAVK